MRILVLDYKDYWHVEAGGSQTYARAMINEFQRMGHEVTVFTCFSDRPRVETVDGVHYVREGTKFTVFHSAKVYLAKHGGDYDVVLDTVNQRPFLAHEIVGNKATALVYHLGLETWNSEFGFPFNVVGRKVLEPEWMRRLRSAPRVLAISESTAESLAHYGVACDGIVPPALSPKDPVLDRVPGSPPRVLFIGRLVNNKRPLDAVRAFELMRDEFPGISMDIVGAGYLIDQIREKESSDLRVWGYVAEEVKESLIQQADLLFVTSVREGWGMVVAEAALLGVPAVAYDVPGLRDSIKDGETGLLTSETPDDLAAAATELLRNRDQWSRLSTAGAQWAASWHWSDAAESLLGHMTAPPTREAWLRANPDELSSPAVTGDGSTKKRFDMKSRATTIAVAVTVVAIALGLVLRLYEAYHMPWRDDEIVYVQWTGSWFSHHLFSYIFQFQQHIYPPRSEFFANPPFAMWIFGVAIWIGRAFSVSALLSARLADVAISLVTNVMLFRTARRWLGPTVAAFAACTFALLPLAITTGASAFLEPTLALFSVLALDAYLRVRERASWPHVMYLASVLGLVLVTKLSLGFVYFLIGLSALIFLVGSGRRRMAVAFAVTSVGLPLVIWSGFRTPSQYRGVIGFLSSKYSSLTVSPDHFRYPFSFLSDIPLIILGAWLLVLVSPLVAERLRDRAPPSLLFIAVLPAVGFVELAITAPTSWDYQLLPLLPFILIPAGWALRRAFVTPHRRRVVTVLTLIGCGELAFMLLAVPLAQLSLSTTPTAALVRYVAPEHRRALRHRQRRVAAHRGLHQHQVAEERPRRGHVRRRHAATVFETRSFDRALVPESVDRLDVRRRVPVRRVGGPRHAARHHRGAVGRGRSGRLLGEDVESQLRDDL